jgi:hypothetical protein
VVNGTPANQGGRSQVHRGFDPQAAARPLAQLGTWAGLERWADTLVDFQEQRGGHGGCPMANLIGLLGDRTHRQPMT